MLTLTDAMQLALARREEGGLTTVNRFPAVVYEFYQPDYFPAPGTMFDPADAVDLGGGLQALFSEVSVLWLGRTYRKLVLGRGDISKHTSGEFNGCSVNFTNVGPDNSKPMSEFVLAHETAGLRLVIRYIDLVRSDVLQDSVILYVGTVEDPDTVNDEECSIPSKEVLGSLLQEIPHREFRPDDPLGRTADDPLFEGIRTNTRAGINFYTEKVSKSFLMFFHHNVDVQRTNQFSAENDQHLGDVMPWIFGRCQMEGIVSSWVDEGTTIRALYIFAGSKVAAIENLAQHTEGIVFQAPPDGPPTTIIALGDPGGDPDGTNAEFDVNFASLGYLSNTAYVVAHFTGSKMDVTDEAPVVSALVFGECELPDASGNFTVKNRSDNPAYIARHVMTSQQGLKLNPGLINDPSFVQAGLWCDEFIKDETNSELLAVEPKTYAAMTADPTTKVAGDGAVYVERYKSGAVVNSQYYRWDLDQFGPDDPSGYPYDPRQTPIDPYHPGGGGNPPGDGVIPIDPGIPPVTPDTMLRYRRRFTFNCPLTDKMKGPDFLNNLVYQSARLFHKTGQDGRIAIDMERPADSAYLVVQANPGQSHVSVSDVEPWRASMRGEILIGAGLVTSELRKITSAMYDPAIGDAITIAVESSPSISLTLAAGGPTLVGGTVDTPSRATIVVGGTAAYGQTVAVTIDGRRVYWTTDGLDSLETVAASVAMIINSDKELGDYVLATWNRGTTVEVTSKVGYMTFLGALENTHPVKVPSPVWPPNVTLLAGGTLTPGTWDLAYSWQSALGETMISPRTQVTTDPTNRRIQTVYMDMPVDVASVNWYMSVRPGNSSLRFVGNAPSGSPYTIASDPVTSSRGEPQINDTGEETIRCLFSWGPKTIREGTKVEWPLGGEAEAINQVYIEYISAVDDFATKQLTVNDWEHQARIGTVNRHEINGRGIDSYDQAVRLANAVLAFKRDGSFRIRWTTDEAGLPYEEGDVGCITDDSGLWQQPVRVEDISISSDCDVSFEGRIYSTHMMKDLTGQKEIAVSSPLKYVAGTPPVVTDVVLSEGQVIIPGGSWISTIHGEFKFGKFIRQQLAHIYIKYFGEDEYRLADTIVPGLDGTGVFDIPGVPPTDPGNFHEIKIVTESVYGYTLGFGPNVPYPVNIGGPGPGGEEGAVDSVFGRTGHVLAQFGDYNWNQISGSTLPVVSGVNVTNLNASQLTSGTIPVARSFALIGDITMPQGSNVTTITDGAVTTPKIRDGAVTTPKIADGAVTKPKWYGTFTGTGDVLALQTSPQFITPWLDVAAAISYNGLTIPTTVGATLDMRDGSKFTLAAGKTLTVNNTLTLNGLTDGLAITFPSSGTVAMGAGALDVVSANNVNVPNHTHSITSSSNPGANRSLLASDFNGYLQLVRLGIGIAPGKPLEVAGDVFIHTSVANFFMRDLNTGLQSASDRVITPMFQNSIRSQNFFSGLVGWGINDLGDAEFNNVNVRGELRASVFKVNEMSATAGTLGVFYSAAILASDLVTPGAVGQSFTFVAKNSDVTTGAMLFRVGEPVRFKSYVNSGGVIIGDIWAIITGYTNNGPTTTYTATLQSGSVNTMFRAGTGGVDYGPPGTGFITLSADGAVGATPNITMATHNGMPWTGFTPLLRIGNLKDSYGYTTNIFGFGTGQYGFLSLNYTAVNVVGGAMGSDGIFIKPITTPDGWNCGMFSSVPIAGDGFIEWTPASLGGPSTAIGLSVNDYDQGVSMDFAIYPEPGTTIVGIWERGSKVGDFGTAAQYVDVFRIERSGSTVTYYKNGGALRTVSNVTSAPLYLDIAMYTSNSAATFSPIRMTGSNSWLNVETTNGVRIGNNVSTRIQLRPDGSGFMASQNIKWTATGLTTISGWTVNQSTLVGPNSRAILASGFAPFIGIGEPAPTRFLSATGIYMGADSDAISFWKMDNGDDYFGRHQLFHGGLVEYMAGKIGNCARIYFNGNGCLYAPSTPDLQTQGGSFCVWGWVLEYYAVGQPQTYACKSVIGGTTGWYLYGLADVARFNLPGLEVTAACGIGAWHLVVAWYDSVVKTINIQVDNGVVSSASYTTPFVDNISPLSFGALRDSSGNQSNRFEGFLDAWGFGKFVPTVVQRNALWNGGAGTESLVLMSRMHIGTIANGVLTAGMSWDGVVLNIVGRVTATTGKIGGFDIGSTKLSGSDIEVISGGVYTAVTWEPANMENVASASGTIMQKTAGGNVWNAKFSSSTPIIGDGWIEWRIRNVAADIVMIGLSYAPPKLTSQNFAFYISSVAHIYESDVTLGQVGTAVANTTMFMIQRIGTSIHYYIDGVWKRTAVCTTAPLYLDVGIETLWTIVGPIRVFSSGGAIALGSPPPTGYKTGTGLWMDSSGVHMMSQSKEKVRLTAMEGLMLSSPSITPVQWVDPYNGNWLAQVFGQGSIDPVLNPAAVATMRMSCRVPPGCSGGRTDTFMEASNDTSMLAQILCRAYASATGSGLANVRRIFLAAANGVAIQSTLSPDASPPTPGAALDIQIKGALKIPNLTPAEWGALPATNGFLVYDSTYHYYVTTTNSTRRSLAYAVWSCKTRRSTVYNSPAYAWALILMDVCDWDFLNMRYTDGYSIKVAYGGPYLVSFRVLLPAFGSSIYLGIAKNSVNGGSAEVGSCIIWSTEVLTSAGRDQYFAIPFTLAIGDRVALAMHSNGVAAIQMGYDWPTLSISGIG